MKHSKILKDYSGSLQELGEDIGNLDYDSLAELFDILTKKFEKDANHDLDINHPQVSQHLKNISKRLQEILDKNMRPLANICREYNEKGIK